ncbi:MAG TPA: CapA family protein, partial [Candidatus Acidoferrales bacterium]|nr:CapA family protein [Candidatus Acidoferrales bacterium]
MSPAPSETQRVLPGTPGAVALRGAMLLASEGEERLTLAALGDVGVIGSGRARAAREGVDSAFRVAAEALRAADVAFANLEFPVAEPGTVRPDRSPEFRHDADVPAALARAGVRVVSLATNHMMDAGSEGLRRTFAACEAAGMRAVGAGANLEEARRPARLEARGQRVVVLAYAQAGVADRASATGPGVAPLDEEV